MSMLDEAPVCAATGREELLSNFGLSSLTKRLASMFRAWNSRRAVMDLRDLDDAQLADVGLKRRDVDAALDLPFSADPSHFLVNVRLNPLRGVRHS